MSGHSHWSGIKHKKELTDQKRSQLFSKLLNAIAIAARQETNLQFNPRLRAAIEKARENSVPQEKIEGAIRRASEIKDLGELIIEAYGLEGVAILIEAITDNKNRTIAEIKKILSDNRAKLAEPGSVLWVFEKVKSEEGLGWREKFTQQISNESREKLENLIEGLLEHDDVQKVYTNA